MTLDMFLRCGCGRAIDVPGRNICFECYCDQQEREPTPTTSAAIGMTVRLDRDIDRDSETARRFGAPSEPIIVRQQEKTMAFEHKPNRGSLFRNDEKTNDDDRDYAGTLNIEGHGEFWVSGWVSETKKGKKYLSLSVKPKDAPPADKSKSRAEQLDDRIPF